MSYRIKLYLVLCLFLLAQGISNSLKAQSQRYILVIDPGHGGRDPGKPRGSNKNKHEKDINLAISLKLGGYIKDKIAGVKVIYTRTKDEYLSLEERAEIANAAKADFFISIHANSSTSRAIYGTETHIYSYKQPASNKLAQLIQKEFASRAGRKSRGIIDARRRGHNLFLTQYTQMPSVLVETGYLSNAKEEEYLNSSYGQSIIASAIFRAFRSLVQGNPPKENRSAFYKVQLMASSKPIDLDAKVFKKLDETIYEYKISEGKYRYKYLIGHEYEADRARKLVSLARKCGFKDAFIQRMDDWEFYPKQAWKSE